MKNAYSIPLTLFYVGLTAAPSLSMAFGLPDAPVQGALAPSQRPPLTATSFAKETYQHELTQWFEKGLGLRGVAVHVDNSILYHAFRETKPGAPVKLGKQALFIDEDIAYYSGEGGDIRPEAEFEALADLVAKAQARVRARGGALVPIIVPSKTSLYPDQVSSGWSRPLGTPRPSEAHVYGAFRRALARRNVAFVDARALLQESKQPRDDLWGADARHWSYFASCITMQRVLGVYAALTARVPPPYECILQRNWAPAALHEDYDLFRLLNVWGARPASPSTIDVVHPGTVAPSAKLRTVFVGTSFTWELLKDSWNAGATQAPHFLYYNKIVVTWPSGKQDPVDAKTELWRDSVLSQDLYVIDLLETYLPSGYAVEFINDFLARFENR